MIDPSSIVRVAKKRHISSDTLSGDSAESKFTGRLWLDSRLLVNHLRIMFLLLAVAACRGRSYAKPMPRYAGATSETLIVFQSANEEYGRATRIHLIDPATGRGTELDTAASGILGQVLSEPHLVSGSWVIGQSGRSAPLTLSAEKNSTIVPYANSQLAPDNNVYLRAGPGALSVVRSDGTSEDHLREEWADCAWITTAEFICLMGPYQERRTIIGYNILSRRRKILYEVRGSAKLENLRLTPDRRTAAFTENLKDSVTIYRLDIRSKACTSVTNFSQRYIFGLEISADGVIAARIVDSQQTEKTLNPYDIWISAPYGNAGQPGYLLGLPALEAPGFFSGRGFLGVDSFAFSPDGKSLALLMSGEGDCRMVDEGGNLACRKDIYVIDRGKAGMRRLTRFAIDSAERLQWRQFTR